MSSELRLLNLSRAAAAGAGTDARLVVRGLNGSSVTKVYGDVPVDDLRRGVAIGAHALLNHRELNVC